MSLKKNRQESSGIEAGFPYSLSYINEIKNNYLFSSISNDTETISSTEGHPQEKLETSDAKKLFHDVSSLHDSTNSEVLVSFSNQIQFYLSGGCEITLLWGINDYQIDVNGKRLEPQVKYSIFQPKWLPAVLIDIKQNKKKIKNIKLSKKLNIISKLSNFQHFDHNSVVTNLNLNSSIICIHLQKLSINEFEWLLKIEDFSIFDQNASYQNKLPKNNIKLPTVAIGTEHFFQTLNINVINIPECWKQGVTTILNFDLLPNQINNNHYDALNEAEVTHQSSEDIKLIICGSKGVGKSTCLKYTLNSLLSKYEKVAVIDCDVGQPEFTVSGLTSYHIITSPILQPTHLNLKTPELSYFIGDISTKSDPSGFIEAFSKLFQHHVFTLSQHKIEYNKRKQKSERILSENMFSLLEESTSSSEDPTSSIPLLINTDGWVRYMGAEILHSIISISQPSHIFHITSEKNQSLLDPFQDSLPRGCQIVSLVPGRQEAGNISAVDMRNLRLVSYFLSPAVLRSHCSSSSSSSSSSGHSIQLSGLHENTTTFNTSDSNSNSNTHSSSDHSSNLSTHQAYPHTAVLHELLKVRFNDFGRLVDPSGAIATAIATLHPAPLGFLPHELAIRLLVSVPPRLVLAALNASLVALVYANASNSDTASSSSSANGNSNRKEDSPSTVVTLSYRHTYAVVAAAGEAQTPMEFQLDCAGGGGELLPCRGLGIVRHIDVSLRKLLLISPLFSSSVLEVSPPWRIANRVHLVKGHLQLPSIVTCSQHFPCSPYHSSEVAGEGGGVMKARDNLKRRSHQEAMP